MILWQDEILSIWQEISIILKIPGTIIVCISCIINIIVSGDVGNTWNHCCCFLAVAVFCITKAFDTPYDFPIIQYLICLSSPCIYEDTAKIVMAQRWLCRWWKDSWLQKAFHSHYVQWKFSMEMKYAHIWCWFLKQKCLLTTWGTKYKVILIIVVAMATEMEAKIKCWLILRQYLVIMATR